MMGCDSDKEDVALIDKTKEERSDLKLLLCYVLLKVQDHSQ